MKRSYEQIIEVAEAYEITINIEVHGYFTTNPDRLAEMLEFCQSPFLRMNLDTGIRSSPDVIPWNSADAFVRRSTTFT